MYFSQLHLSEKDAKEPTGTTSFLKPVYNFVKDLFDVVPKGIPLDFGEQLHGEIDFTALIFNNKYLLAINNGYKQKNPSTLYLFTNRDFSSGDVINHLKSIKLNCFFSKILPFTNIDHITVCGDDKSLVVCEKDGPKKVHRLSIQECNDSIELKFEEDLKHAEIFASWCWLWPNAFVVENDVFCYSYWTDKLQMYNMKEQHMIVHDLYMEDMSGNPTDFNRESVTGVSFLYDQTHVLLVTEKLQMMLYNFKTKEQIYWSHCDDENNEKHFIKKHASLSTTKDVNEVVYACARSGCLYQIFNSTVNKDKQAVELIIDLKTQVNINPKWDQFEVMQFEIHQRSSYCFISVSQGSKSRCYDNRVSDCFLYQFNLSNKNLIREISLSYDLFDSCDGLSLELKSLNQGTMYSPYPPFFFNQEEIYVRCKFGVMAFYIAEEEKV